MTEPIAFATGRFPQPEPLMSHRRSFSFFGFPLDNAKDRAAEQFVGLKILKIKDQGCFLKQPLSDTWCLGKQSTRQAILAYDTSANKNQRPFLFRLSSFLLP